MPQKFFSIRSSPLGGVVTSDVLQVQSRSLLGAVKFVLHGSLTSVETFEEAWISVALGQSRCV